MSTLSLIYVRDHGRIFGPFTRLHFQELQTEGIFSEDCELSGDRITWTSCQEETQDVQPIPLEFRENPVLIPESIVRPAVPESTENAALPPETAPESGAEDLVRSIGEALAMSWNIGCFFPRLKKRSPQTRIFCSLIPPLFSTIMLLAGGFAYLPKFQLSLNWKNAALLFFFSLIQWGFWAVTDVMRQHREGKVPEALLHASGMSCCLNFGVVLTGAFYPAGGGEAIRFAGWSLLVFCQLWTFGNLRSGIVRFRRIGDARREFCVAAMLGWTVFWCTAVFLLLKKIN